MYEVTCEENCINSVDADELEEILEAYSCSCGANISSVYPDEIEIECACGWEETTDWQTAVAYLDGSCPRCEINTGASESLHIKGSLNNIAKEYDWFANYESSKKLLRINRDDYWEYLTHYTDFNSFKSIILENKLRSSATGLFGKSGVKAICFTETPPKMAEEIRSNFGEYGIVFKKSDLIKCGALPVHHYTDDLLNKIGGRNKIPVDMRPYANIVRIGGKSKKWYFLHEREWRVQNSLNLRKVKPFGLILPDGKAKEVFKNDIELLEDCFSLKNISF